MIRYLSIILILFQLMSCSGTDDEVGPYVAEQTDYYDGITYHRFYRYTGNLLGYATSSIGVTFEKYAGNPIMDDSLFPYLVVHEGNRYLIVQHRKGSTAYYLYNVNDPTYPRIVNEGRPILEGGFFNVGVTVVGNRWHMLVEGKADDTFHLRYSWADFPDLNFNTNISAVVINDAGNPYISYIPSRDALLAVYGEGYKRTGVWSVTASTALISSDMSLAASWRASTFRIFKPGIHIADPDLGCGIERLPLIITVGSAQNAVSTYYFLGTNLNLYDAILAGPIQIEEDAKNPTMTW